SKDVADIAVEHFRVRPWPEGSTVEALCVVDQAGLAGMTRFAEDLTKSAEELVQYTAGRLQELEVSARSIVLSGNPKDVIVDHAAKTGADFILIGAHEEIGRRRFLLGSVAKAVLRLAPCSVEVLRAPAKGEISRTPRVMLATDGSDCSLAAAQSIADRPWPAGVEIRILSVTEPYASLFHVPFPPGAEGVLRTEAVPRMQRAIRDAEAVMNDAGLQTSESTSVQMAEPESVIAIEAAKWDADLIVLGSHGRRGFSRLLLGSVSESVALHAGCCVEVIRPAHARSQALSVKVARAHDQTMETACC